MKDFFSNEIGASLPWFGVAHLLLLIGFFISLSLIWVFGPKIKNSKYEPWVRYVLLLLLLLFEYQVFENRLLNGSIFRLPLCAISLYGLTFAMMFKNERAYKIFYFYAFGTLLTFLFFDTPWGLDRWGGWKYFGAHATIGWFAVYGYRVFGYTPTKKDVYLSIGLLAIYSLISGYATYRYGGSDELFLFHAPVDFMNFLIDIHQVVYLLVFIPLAALLTAAMYVPIYLSENHSNT